MRKIVLQPESKVKEGIGRFAERDSARDAALVDIPQRERKAWFNSIIVV